MRAMFSLVAIGCLVDVVGNGKVASETRQVAEFVEVEVNNSVQMDLTIDPKAAGDVELTVEAESNLLDYVVTDVVLGVLSADVDGQIRSHEALSVSGTSGPLGRVSGDNAARVEVAGIAGQAIELQSNNAADVWIMGTVDALTVDANNSGNVDADDLTARTAVVELNNGAHAVLCVTDSVTGTVDNGAGLTVRCGGSISGVEARNGGTVQ